jgi:DNA-binding response OmpR family regulator
VPSDEGEAGRSILVVSRDERIAEEARLGFNQDLEIVHARDAREAIALLRTFLPACVIVDIHTGSSGGVGLSRDMQDLAHLRDVPILMLLERDQDRWLAGQAGADAIRTKPLGTSELVDEVTRLIASATDDAA